MVIIIKLFICCRNLWHPQLDTDFQITGSHRKVGTSGIEPLFGKFIHLLLD